MLLKKAVRKRFNLYHNQNLKHDDYEKYLDELSKDRCFIPDILLYTSEDLTLNGDFCQCLMESEETIIEAGSLLVI